MGRREETPSPEEIAAAEARLAGAEPPLPPAEERYVGRGPERQEQLEEAIRIALDKALNDERAAHRNEVATIQQQLLETQELVRKLAKERGGEYAQVATDVARQEAMKERRRVYREIELGGGSCTITVHSHEDPAYNKPVPVAVNGIAFLIPRGEPIIVPWFVLEALDNAILDTFMKVVGDDGNPRVQRHTLMSYPYSLIDRRGRSGRPALPATDGGTYALQ